MYCVYHSADFDGWTSGAIVKYKYPSCKLIKFNYGQILPEFNKGEEIIMIDVSIPPEKMNEIAKLHKFTWIDHHESSKNDYDKYIKTNKMPESFTAVLDMRYAACELGWKYLMKSRVPVAVALVGKYDTWKNKNEKLWMNYILPFQWGLRKAVHGGADNFPQELFKDDVKSKQKIKEIISLGNDLLVDKRKQNSEIVKNSFIVDFEGYRTLTVILKSAFYIDSNMFVGFYDPKKHDMTIQIYKNKDKKWKFSLRSIKENVDVSVIAKKYGGGGHVHASSFVVDNADFFFNLIPQSDLHKVKDQIDISKYSIK